MTNPDIKVTGRPVITPVAGIENIIRRTAQRFAPMYSEEDSASAFQDGVSWTLGMLRESQPEIWKDLVRKWGDEAFEIKPENSLENMVWHGFHIYSKRYALRDWSILEKTFSQAVYSRKMGFVQSSNLMATMRSMLKPPPSAEKFIQLIMNNSDPERIWDFRTIFTVAGIVNNRESAYMWANTIFQMAECSEFEEAACMLSSFYDFFKNGLPSESTMRNRWNAQVIPNPGKGGNINFLECKEAWTAKPEWKVMYARAKEQANVG